MQEFQIATVRPPTENFSLSISTHFSCPWGKCAFCGSETSSRNFKRRLLQEIKKDIDNAAALNEYLFSSGYLDKAKILDTFTKFPKLNQCINHLIYWHLYANASTAFLGGANPLLYKCDFLEHILIYWKQIIPTINRITSYGRTRTAAKKGCEYFRRLHDAGLDRIHVGLESGSDNVLEFMNKGAISKEHIIGGKSIKDGGISLCTYVMPGLGGKKWSKEHALETAKVINEIEPEFVRLRTLEIFPNTILYGKKESGLFEELNEEDVVKEEKILVENIECNTTITSDSAANLLLEIWGNLPIEKKKILRSIDNYLSLTPEQKIEFSLKRRTEAYSSQYGEFSPEITKKLKKLSVMSKNDEDYYNKAEELIKYIRRRLIP
ncbi:MAG: radical SAM protein [Candidatus Hodarchaeota archaeon]